MPPKLSLLSFFCQGHHSVEGSSLETKKYDILLGMRHLFLVVFCLAFVDLIKSEYMQSWSATSKKTYVLKDVGERHKFFFYQPTAPKAKQYKFYWGPNGTYGAGFYRINHGDEGKWHLGKDKVPHCIMCCSNRRFPRSIYLIYGFAESCQIALNFLLLVVIIVRAHKTTLGHLKSSNHVDVLPAGCIT